LFSEINASESLGKVLEGFNLVNKGPPRENTQESKSFQKSGETSLKQRSLIYTSSLAPISVNKQ
jgi:hypothetical protein